MRTIVHLSDLHFGKVHVPTLQPLRETVEAMKPDLIAVSGDLTQRARTSQFREARAFLDTLPKPQIVVPGNHDVPLFNVLARFAQPLTKYKRWITEDLTPSFVDEEIAVLGINTARSLTHKSGRVNVQQVEETCADFAKALDGQVRIVVTHHPFDVPRIADEDDIVGRAGMAMECFAKCGVDVFLAGHLHLLHCGSIARYKIPGYSALAVQAGTATSTRGRHGEENSFNLLRIERPTITIETHVWQPSALRFAKTHHSVFAHSEKGWMPVVVDD
jgi:3',5'-cyclic AMP phosphodiesterase CpdA